MRLKSLFSLVAASLITVLPVHAWAQDNSVRGRDRPDYDPAGAQVGAFNLNASVDLAVTSTDNVFASDSPELDDMIITISPQMRLASGWSRHSVVFDAGGNARSYDEYDNEDAEEYYAGAAGRLDIGSSSSVSGSVRYAHEVSPRTDPDSPFVGNPVEYDFGTYSVGAAHRFARTRVSGELRHNQYDYDGVQAYRDNQEDSLRGRVEHELSPRISLLVQGTVDEREYNNTPTLDSEGRSILVGATIDTDLMRGEIAVGQFDRDYAGIQSFDGVAVSGSLEWYATRLTTVTFDARRDADDQVGATSGLPFITQQFGARVDHELQRNLILTAGASFGNRDYDTIDREDDYTSFDLGADYMLNRRVALRLRYEHDEVDSSGAAAYRDYEVNAVTAGLTLRL